MAVDPTPLVNDLTLNSKDFRAGLRAVLGGTPGAFAGGVGATNGAAHGVVGASDFRVTENGTPNLSVNVAPGMAVITGTVAAEQGPYAQRNASETNVTLAAADPVNPRDDLIIAQVRDAQYSGVEKDFRVTAVTGTPAAVPADPSLASYPNALVLARVRVAASATSVTNANITDLRTFAGYYRISTPDDSGIQALPVSASFPSGTLRYRKRGIWVEVNCNIAKDGNNSSNTTFNLATLPEGFRPWGTVACAGVTSNPTDGVCRVTISPTTGVITANNLTINGSSNFSFYVMFSADN